MAIHLRDVGIIRCATPEDAILISRLMAAHGTEALPLTAADVDAAGARGLDLASGPTIRYVVVASEPTETTAAELRALRREVGRRISLCTAMLLSLPGVMLGATSHPASLAVLMWSTLSLIRVLREPRIPRAIVRRGVGARRIDRNQT